MSLSLDEIREFSLMALDQPPAVKKKKDECFIFTVSLTEIRSVWFHLNHNEYSIYLEDLNIHWGDGTSQIGPNETYGGYHHVYDSFGTYQIKIYGNLEAFDIDDFGLRSNHTIISLDSPLPSTVRQFCIHSSYNIETIPNNLFDKCKDNILDLTYAFAQCTSLKYVPFDLLRNCPNLESVYGTFTGCSKIISSVPDLWNTHLQNILHGRCYSRCINAANYSDIPSDWR